MSGDKSKGEANVRIAELVDLWIGGSPANLGCIPELCEQIADLVRRNDVSGVDWPSLRRAVSLATKGHQRLTSCLAIQARLGTYSPSGVLDTASLVATAGWEG